MFNGKGCTVSIGVVDLSKAFDKVNFFALLSVLIKNNVSKYVVGLLENWFLKSSAIVKWDSSKSETFKLSSGVRQGGVLSPLLFSLYVDSVLKSLENSKLGCYIGDVCCNSFMYADDLILISSSVTGLQSLLKLCATSFTELDLPINLSKCHCLRIGPRWKKKCANINICGQKLEWVKEIGYLGITIKSGPEYRCTWDKSKAKFYRSANTILSKLKNEENVDICLNLIDKQALPQMIYAIASATLQKSDVKNLSFAYNSVFCRLFNTSNVNVIKWCQIFCGHLPIEFLYDYYRLCWLRSLTENDCILNEIFVDDRELDEIKQLHDKYGINAVTPSKAHIVSKIWSKFELSVL